MAILLQKGTNLETHKPKRPLNKLFLILVGCLYLFLFHLFSWQDQGQGIERYSNQITWLMTLGLLLTGVVQISRNKTLRYSKLTFGLSICCLLLTLPILESDANVTLALPRLCAVWLGWLLFLTLQQFGFNNKYKQRLLWFIVMSSLVGSFISYLIIAAHYFKPSLLNHYFEQSWHTYFHYQSYSVFYMTGMLASGYLLARRVRKYLTGFSPVILLYITPAATLPLILKIYSPIIWLILFVSLGALFRYLIAQMTIKRLIGWTLSVLFGVIVGISVLCCALGDTGSDNKPIDNNPLTDSISQTTDMLIERPFTGYGYGRFTEEYVLYTARQHALNSHFPPAIQGLTSPHSEILSWTIDGGLIPFLAILLSVLFVLFRGYFARKGARLATFSLLFPIVFGSISSDILQQTHILWITLIILLYWLDQRVTRYRKIPLSIWKMKSIQTLGIPFVLVAGMYLVLIGHNHYFYEQYRQTGSYHELSEILMPTIYKDQVLIAKIRQELEQDESNQNLKKMLPSLLTIITHTPTPSYYHLLIHCYTHLGEENKALQTRLEANYLFPNVTFK